MKQTLLLLVLWFSLYTVGYTQDAAVDAADTVQYTDDEYFEETETVTHVNVKPQELNSTKTYVQEKIPVSRFDKAKWKQITEKDNFEEKREEEKEEDIKPKEESHWFSDWLKNSNLGWLLKGLYSWLPYIAYALIVCLIVVILVYVIKNISPGTNKIRKSVIRENDFSESVENIEDLDVHSSLQQVIASGNYKLAVRMYFLDLLKLLHQQGKINWKKDKTNREYLSEVFATGFYFNEIRKLTLAYEIVWYGEHALAVESFQQLFTDFESLKLKFNPGNIR